jgi:hypothetical protein
MYLFPFCTAYCQMLGYMQGIITKQAPVKGFGVKYLSSLLDPQPLYSTCSVTLLTYL